MDKRWMVVAVLAGCGGGGGGATTPDAATPGADASVDAAAGSGLFAPAVGFPAGGASFSIALGDVNGDAKPDVAVTNYMAATVSVLLDTTPTGAATPTFAEPVTFATGAMPGIVVFADLDGDGKPDLAIANQGTVAFSILINTTAPGAAGPSFAATRTLPAQDPPYGLAVADLDGDRVPDLVTVHPAEGVIETVVDPLTRDASAIALGSGFLESVALADFDGDGRLDAVVGDVTAGGVSIATNPLQPAGRVQLNTPAPVATVSMPYGLAAADFNGDGVADLAIVSYDGGTLSVLLGAGGATFGAPLVLPTGDSPIAVATADLDGDGALDLVVANENGSSVSVFLGGGSAGGFAPAQTYATARGPSSVAIGDINGDGKPDLAVANAADGGVTILLAR